MRTAARVTAAPAWVVECPAEDPDAGRCGHRLQVRSDLAEQVHCRACGSTWTGRRLLTVAASDKGATIMLDAAAVFELLGVPETTLRRWARKGRGRREHGLYDLADVHAAMLTPVAPGRTG